MREAGWIIITAGDCVIGIPVLYLAVLSVVALIRSRRKPSALAEVSHPEWFAKSFVVLVPAHNEETGLARTLANLGEIEYPHGCWKICVIADNCTDSTAEVARQFPGVDVYVRDDLEHRGKGFALEWGATPT